MIGCNKDEKTMEQRIFTLFKLHPIESTKQKNEENKEGSCYSLKLLKL
jgi:hypothetical protein